MGLVRLRARAPHWRSENEGSGHPAKRTAIGIIPRIALPVAWLLILVLSGCTAPVSEPDPAVQSPPEVAPTLNADVPLDDCAVASIVLPVTKARVQDVLPFGWVAGDYSQAAEAMTGQSAPETGRGGLIVRAMACDNIAGLGGFSSMDTFVVVQVPDNSDAPTTRVNWFHIETATEDPAMVSVLASLGTAAVDAEVQVALADVGSATRGWSRVDDAVMLDISVRELPNINALPITYWYDDGDATRWLHWTYPEFRAGDAECRFEASTTAAYVAGTEQCPPGAVGGTAAGSWPAHHGTLGGSIT